MATLSKADTPAGVPEHSKSSCKLDLVGHVAVVTGASRGIGRAIALNLALRGCSILGTCANEASLKLISSVLDSEVSQSYKHTAHSRPAELQIKGLIADIFSLECPALIANQLAESFNGRVDIFVNNACDPMPVSRLWEKRAMPAISLNRPSSPGDHRRNGHPGGSTQSSRKHTNTRHDCGRVG